MATETLGKYQLHLIAHELPGDKGWDAYLTVDYFSDEAQDFICQLEKQRVGDKPFPSYEAAIEASRRFGNAYILGRQ